MRVFRLFLIISSIMLLIPFLSLSVEAVTCESCHSSRNASGGYIYDDPLIDLIHDPFYSPGDEFEFQLVIRPQPDYSISELNGDVSISGTTVGLKGGGRQAGVVQENGDMLATWTLTSLDEGESKITVDFNYKVYFKHTSSGNKDIGTYYDRKTAQILVSDLSMSISPGSVILSEFGESKIVELTAEAFVHDIEVIVPEELGSEIDVSLGTSSLMAGTSTTITITLLNETNLESEIEIKWKEISGDKKVPVKITIGKIESTDTGDDPLLKIGQATGISAFILLVIGYFTGGTGFLKKYANKLFKHAKRRIRFHCALSYLVLILSFYHLATLWYGPYREVIFSSWEIVLGEVAVITMIIISINGIFQIRMIKWMGFQNWRRIHSWGSYISTTLVVIHLLTYGSHFLWFRELVGLQ
jgi:hypothetical protein